MLNIRKAELDDVDMLLDMKLDIILSSDEIAELDELFSVSQDGNADDWGEQIDFSVEEILDMPTVCEVQMNPTKKGSVADSDLDSEGDKTVLSEEEAWDLFA